VRYLASTFYRPAVFLGLAALTAGCSSVGSSTAPTTLTNPAQTDSMLAKGLMAPPHAGRSNVRGWIAPDAKKGRNLIYWGDYDTSTITIFSSRGNNPSPKGKITEGLLNPERIFVDKRHKLYATNIGGSGNGDITVYKPGTTSPSLTISNGVDRPTGITVDAAGTVYCANVGNNTVTEYPKGAKSPSRTISMSTTPQYLAVDSADSLYVSDGINVTEFAKGSLTGKALGLAIGGSGGIEVDKSGNIIIIDTSVPSLDVFPAGQTKPSKQIVVTSGDPFALSLSSNEKTVYMSVGNGSNFIIQAFAYPNGTTLTNKITANDGQWPIAVSPDAVL
jgi:hypothetical protein